MASNNLIQKIFLDDKEFEFFISDLENRVNKIETDNQDVYTKQYGWQTMADAMRSVADAAEKAIHGVYEAMSRIYCLEDQLSGSSASAEIETQDENLLGEFFTELSKTNMFLQNLK